MDLEKKPMVTPRGMNRSRYALFSEEERKRFRKYIPIMRRDFLAETKRMSVLLEYVQKVSGKELMGLSAPDAPQFDVSVSPLMKEELTSILNAWLSEFALKYNIVVEKKKELLQ